LSYRVEVDNHARHELLKLGREQSDRVASAIDSLATDPRPTGSKKLKGRLAELWRVRVGSFRVVYRIDDREKAVRILRVADRKDIY